MLVKLSVTACGSRPWTSRAMAHFRVSAAAAGAASGRATAAVSRRSRNIGIFRLGARVRQALSALERDGLVTPVPNRGAFVVEPSIEEARDIFIAHRTIKAQLVRRLCAIRTPEAIARLEDHVARERSARDRGDKTDCAPVGRVPSVGGGNWRGRPTCRMCCAPGS